MMANREHLVRALWTLFEPIHAVTYFSTEAREAFAEVGLTRYWDGYFAGRSAPLGAVGGAPVIAIFSGFSPAFANRALPAAWSVASPERVLEARSAGAAATLRAMATDEDAVARAAETLTDIASRVDTVGRPLAAANAALPAETDPYRALWQAAATLREHRGDGHVAALVTEDIAGLTTLLLRSGNDLEPGAMQKARGWTDEEWEAEGDLLVSRGLLDSGRRITASGADALNRVEHVTNHLAVGPWAHLDDAGLIDIARLLSPIAESVADVFPYPNPIGMPHPWNPDADPAAASVPEVPAP
jgi:hypothetical protein